MKTWNCSLLALAALAALSAETSLSAPEAPKATAAAPTPTTTAEVKNLAPENKSTLKQMILMKGRIEKACDERDPDSCLPNTVNTSSTAPKSEAKAAAVEKSSQKAKDERIQVVRELSKDCKAGGAGACKRLAVISQEMDKSRTSMQLYKMACEHGDALVCRELAEKLDRAGKKDLAILYLERACQRGDMKSCPPKAMPTKQGASKASAKL